MSILLAPGLYPGLLDLGVDSMSIGMCEYVTGFETHGKTV
mgnify:CR=1 FL=1